MFLLTTLLLPLLLVPATALPPDDLPQALAAMLANVAALKPATEINLLLDFSLGAQTQLLSHLNEMGVAAYVYDINARIQYQASLPYQPCPIYDMLNYVVAKNKKADWLLPTRYFHRSVFIWTSDLALLEQVYVMLNATTVVCVNQIDVGVFNENTRFYIFVDQADETDMTEIFEGHEMYFKHPKVALVRRIKPEAGSVGIKFAFHNLNFFVKNATVLNLSAVWTPSRPLLSPAQTFTNTFNFLNYSLTITAIPWSNFLNGDEVDTDPEHVWTNFWGFEVNLLKTIGRLLNYTYTIYNPVDQLWGRIEDNGLWSGMIHEAAVANAEMAISAIIFRHSRAQMVHYSVPFTQDFVTFAAPNPKPKPKTLAIVEPFDPVVWLCVVASVIVVTFSFYVIGTLEGRIKHVSFPPYDNPQVLWLVLSQLCLQNHADTMKEVSAVSIRVALSMWLMATLLVTATYSGMLKSFLTSPTYLPTIDTLEEIVKSGLPWEMVLYGEDEEAMMARSTDPIIKAIWDKKIVVDFSPSPNIDQVYAGKMIFIDWWSGLHQNLVVKYSTLDGRPLVHVPPHPVYTAPYQLGWAFHPFNPWRLTFDVFITRIIEAGLVLKWNVDTLNKMKDDARARGEKAFSANERPDVSPMELSDFQSAYLLIGIIFSAAFLTLLIEFILLRKRYNSRSVEDDDKILLKKAKERRKIMAA